MMLLSYKTFRQKIDEALLIAVSTSVFLPIKISSVIIMLALGNFFFDRNVFSKLHQILTSKIALWLIGFYIIHIVSAFFSMNTKEALSMLERKLSFLVFPILFFGSKSEISIRNISLSFAVACQIAILLSLGAACINYYNTSDYSVFLYHDLSSFLGLNAIYLSIYCAFSLFTLFYYFKSLSEAQKIIAILNIGFLWLGLILLSSKNLLFVTLLGAILFLVYNWKTKYKTWFIMVSILVFSLPILLIKPVKQRFMVEFNANTEVVHLKQYKYDTPFTGLTLRLVIWKICFEIINDKQAWISGVGIGDFQDLLNQKYIEKGIYTGNKQLGDTGYIGYGPHNQWVEVFFSMGLIGLIYFIWFISFIINHYSKSGNMLALLFVFIFVSVSMTECVLSVNKGIVFFAFFICLFNGYNCRTISRNTSAE